MFTRRQFLRRLPPLTAAAAAVTGCQKPPESLYNYELPEIPLQVVTTTVQLLEMVEAIGGEAVSVSSLMQPGENPHRWEPVASDIAMLRLADVAVLNGLGLEARLAGELEGLRKSGVITVLAGDAIPAAQLIHPAGAESAPDPHVWMDPALWSLASMAVEQALRDAFPPAAAWFAARAHEYRVDLDKLSSWAATIFRELPEDRRRLFTSHDTCAYPAKAYGLEYRSLGPAAGPAPETASPALRQWLQELRVRSLFREAETDSASLSELLRPLNVSPDYLIFSLSTAAQGRRMMSTYQELEVGRLSGALRYSLDIIQSRLMLD